MAGVVLAAAVCASAQADTQMTTDQAEALAQVLVLTSGDLPGYEGSRPEKLSREDRQQVARYVRCAGAVPRNQALAEVYSDDFEPTGDVPDSSSIVSVTSVVTVQQTTALAEHDLAAFRSERGLKCERKYGIVRPTTGDFNFSIIQLPDPAPGVWKQRMKIRSRTWFGRKTYFLDVFSFQRGQADIELATVSSGRLFPPAEEQRLLGVLRARAQQQIPQ